MRQPLVDDETVDCLGCDSIDSVLTHWHTQTPVRHS